MTSPLVGKAQRYFFVAKTEKGRIGSVVSDLEEKAKWKVARIESESGMEDGYL